MVAVKFQQNKEFIIEAQQLAKIKHDNIITVFGYTIKEDCNVIVMEYAEGGCLENGMFLMIYRFYLTFGSIS